MIEPVKCSTAVNVLVHFSQRDDVTRRGTGHMADDLPEVTRNKSKERVEVT